MPDMSDEATKPPSPIKDALSSVLSPLPIGFAGIFVVVGLVIAELIYGLGDHAKFDERIGNDNGFLFLAAIVFARAGAPDVALQAASASSRPLVGMLARPSTSSGNRSRTESEREIETSPC